jgi:hypothetical protein
MTRLDRLLNLLEEYDRLVDLTINDDVCRFLAPSRLEDLRKEKEKLTQELIEYGCRRKN